VSSPDNSKNYHHGDLRNALISAAAELIEENGSVDFAMIDAARRAGVSSAAPYRHFKDKEALVDAVAQLAFLALREAVEAATNEHTNKDEDCIIAQGKAYLSFQIKHPQFYDLMWGDYGLRVIDAENGDMKTSGFYILVNTVQAWCDSLNMANHDALELAVKLWAMAHGLACLAMNRHVEKFMPEANVYELLESSTRTFLDGVKRSC
jgi:AcrR family transcriptional regulator